MSTEVLNDAAELKVTTTGTWLGLKARRIHLLITKDDDSSFSAFALNLPGAGSCGSSEEEAIKNAKEAILATLESYEEGGKEIPWKDTSSAEIPFGARDKWIYLNG